MRNGAAIQTEGLVKRFGALTAVDDVNLHVEPGITYGMLGPNGSGKTTIIRMLLGVLPPTSGSISVLGKPVPNHQLRAQIGYMPQATALYEDLTVRENVAFYARLMGSYGSSRVGEVIELVELRGRRDSAVATLSGGMKRRTSLACALVHSPALLFLDEPTVGVDPELRMQFWDYFRDLNRQGITIVVSTHIMDEAERCDRLGMLSNGRLVSEGAAEELRERAGTKGLEAAFLRFSSEGSAQDARA